MSNTKTTPTTFFGLFEDGYKSTDGEGHAGYGNTKEASNEALQEARDKDVTSAEKNLLWWNYGDSVERD